MSTPASPALGFLARQRFGPVEPEPGPTTQTPAPAPAPAPATLPSGVPNNLFSRIGLVLSNVSAGMQGQVLPTERLAQQMTQRRQVELQELQAGLTAMKTGAGILKSLPVERQADFAQRFGTQYESIIPGFTDMFESMAASHGADLENVLDLFDEHKEVVRVLSGGDANKARELFTDEDFRGRLQEDSDDARMPMIGNKVGAILQMAQRSLADPSAEEGNRFLRMVSTDSRGFPIMTVQNLRDISQNLTGDKAQYALNEKELGTLGRRGNELASLGLVMPEQMEEAVKKRLVPDRAYKEATGPGGRKQLIVLENGEPVKKFDMGETQATPALIDSAMEMRGEGMTVPAEVVGETVANWANTVSPEQAKGTTIKKEQQIPVGEKTTLKAEAKAVVKAKTKLATDKANLAASSSLLRRVAASEEGAFGVRGAAAEAAAGWIGQIDAGLANDLVKWVSGGMSAQEVKTLRTELQSFVAKQIKTVTGEESGRYTEAEQALTRRVVAALEVGASRESVHSALTALTMLQELQTQADSYHIRANKVDLTGDDWREQGKAYDNRLKALGVESPQDRQDMLEHLFLIQQELEATRIGQP